MPATTAVTDGPDGPVVRIAGAFDVASSGAVQQVLVDLVTAETPSITVDLGSVHFMDSTGLRALNITRKRSDEHGGHVTLLRAVPEVRRVIEMLGMAPYFKIVDDH